MDLPKVPEHGAEDLPAGSDMIPPNKKMKFQTGEDEDMEDGDKPTGKVSHNAIEKRRRDKMNMYIDELAAMVPMCSVVSGRPDKLTILKMAVRHLKALRYANGGTHKSQLRPTFLTDEELKHLILEAEDGFLFIVSCENTRILYVSDSVNHVLQHSKNDLCELGFLDIVHACDQELVKEQLMVTEADLPDGDKKSTTADFNMISGSRRSFFCRMRKGKRCPETGLVDPEKRKPTPTYSIVHVTGYLKNWDADTFSMTQEMRSGGEESEEEQSNFTCLVAVGRILKVPVRPSSEPNEFNWRLTMDDKFLFVDPRTTSVVEYLPHELIGQSVYKYYHPQDITQLSEAHHKVSTTQCEVMYRFRAKSGKWVWLHAHFHGFHNPFSGQLQYIICTNTAMRENKSEVMEYKEFIGNSAVDENSATPQTHPQQPLYESIRTPQSVTPNVEIARQQHEDPASKADVMQQISSQSREMEQRISSVQEPQAPIQDNFSDMASLQQLQATGRFPQFSPQIPRPVSRPEQQPQIPRGLGQAHSQYSMLHNSSGYNPAAVSQNIPMQIPRGSVSSQQQSSHVPMSQTSLYTNPQHRPDIQLHQQQNSPYPVSLPQVQLPQPARQQHPQAPRQQQQNPLGHQMTGRTQQAQQDQFDHSRQLYNDQQKLILQQYEHLLTKQNGGH